MREGIHPDYKVCKVTCACGNTFETKSMKEEMRLDVCSACHPFFTGQQKFINRGGRVRKIQEKVQSRIKIQLVWTGISIPRLLLCQDMFVSVILFSEVML